MRIEEPPRRRRLVSLTPLIDVVFILLIFFMLASTFVEWQAFQVDAPTPDAVEADDEEEPLRVEVTPDGYRIEARSMGLGEVTERLRELAEQEPERPVWIVPEPGAPVGPIMQALDAAEGAGLAEVGVVRGEAP